MSASWLSALFGRGPGRESGPTGIVWFGHVYDPSGFGSVSRNYLLGLAATGVPIQVVNIGQPPSPVIPRDVVETIQRLEAGKPGASPVGILHAAPDLYPKLRRKNRRRRIVKWVGITIFETDRLPAAWPELCNEMDEIWIPSEFNRQTFGAAGVDPQKLFVIPYSLDLDYFRPIEETFPVPDLRGFSFLYVSFFDWRKGFDLLLRAYFNEFGASEDVTLVLRTSFKEADAWADNPSQHLLDMLGMEVDATDPELPHLVVLTTPLEQDDLRRLYATCDLYISTDRANGWGMPCMEAMAMGRPAATIDWSGSTEFMTAENSLLIHPTGELEPVDSRLVRDRGELYRDHRWAEVDVAEVQRVMRDAFENRERVQAIAQKGQESVRAAFGLVPVAEQIVSAAERLRSS